MKEERGTKARLGLFLAPAAALALLLFGDLTPGSPELTRMAAVAVLMAGWWVTEAIPIPATALLPVALFPLLGIMPGKHTAGLYFNSIVFLFIGGFLFALAMQRWDLHRRIALRILLVLGASPRRMVLGFMAASWFLSMWISNTASTMMMVPMAMAIIVQLKERFEVKRLPVALLLGIAYAASIGGLATLIGTPPNLSFVRILEIVFPGAPVPSFAIWFLFALPLSAVFLLIAWWVLCRMLLHDFATAPIQTELFRKERERLGPITYEQGVVLAAFVLLVGAWMTRADIDLFGLTLPGWSNLFPKAGYIDDGTVAITIALTLFMIPSRARPRERLMDWESAAGIRWGIVLLFGGGFALASGFKETGLSDWMGAGLASLGDAPPVLLVMSVSGLMTFMTELTSNTATTEMALPVVGSLAVALQTDPLLLMVPATLSASCAFMLPVATPPNAIVFGSGEVTMSDMMRVGIVLNLLGVVLITVAVYLLGPPILGIEPGVVPEWAQGR